MILCLGTTPAVQMTMTFASALQLDAVNRAASVAHSASGKSINVARVAAALGAPVLATGFLGGDGAPFVRRDLDAAAIAHDFVDVAPATRTCVTVIDQRAATATELIEESHPVEPRAWQRLLDRLDAHLPAADVLVLSGTLTPGAPQDFYAACVARASSRSVRSIVDATGDPLRHALAARPFIAKPNRSELARTLGADTSTDAGLRDAMRQAAAMGPQWVIVTLGAAGAMATDGQTFWRIAIPSVSAVNPIGSGDAFAAGLAVALSRGIAMPHAAALGAACGVANALTPLAGHVRPDDVARLAAGLELELV